jgi:ligand-binding sensor domain-containing protein
LYKYLTILCWLLCCRLQATEAQTGIAKRIALNENGHAVKITALYKNRLGIIYAGTANGLYTFDGTPNFRKLPMAAPAVKAPVTAVFEDSARRLWVGFENGQIAFWQHNQLQPFAPEEGLPQVAITCFAEDALGQLWFGTNGEGIYYTSGRHLYNIDEADGLSDKNIHAMLRASNGDILAATDQGLNICKAKGGQKNIRALTSAQGLPDNLITSLAPAGNDVFWVGMQDKGYCRYHHAAQRFDLPSTGWQAGQVNAIQATANTLWLATDNNGLFAQPLDRPYQPAPPLLALGAPVTGFVFDNEGNGWLAAGNTIVRTTGERLQLFPTGGNNTFANTHALMVAANGDIWMGSKFGVERYTPATGQRMTVPLSATGNGTVVTALHQDVNGTIWIGTMGRGIILLNPATGKFRSLAELPPPVNRSVLTICSKGNEVFVSSLEGPLLATVPRNGGSYQFTSYANIAAIGSSYVYDIFKDNKGRLWFASFGKGVTMLHNGAYTTFNKANGLPSDIVYEVAEDRQGRIWFSTGDAGVCCYDGKKFTTYGTAQGLSSLEVSGIKVDGQGNVVVVHKRGLDIINPQTGSVGYVGSGLGIDRVNADDLGCVAQDSTGAVYFSSEQGIGRYSTGSGLQLQPVTIIENVQLLLQDIGTAPHGVFAHDEDNFTFHFNGLYYSDPAQVQYQYKLEGYNTDWIATKNQDAPFPKLPPGSYTFRVRSSLSGRFEGASEATYAFTIAKPFWKTWWFIALAALVVAGLLYWYVKSREKNLKHVERLRQEKIQFQFQVLRNQVNPHFLFNSFNTLITTIEEDPKAAVNYVEQLSDFFRNIVNYRDKDVIALQEEIGLLHTYFYLQQQRYGSNLQLDVRLGEKEGADIFIPPLTLQLLAENAIKHNAVSREQRLRIEVFVNEQGYIVVQNNINPRLDKAAGAGMGLQNIVNRYGLLSQRQVQINNTGSQFIVLLPVLKK